MIGGGLGTAAPGYNEVPTRTVPTSSFRPGSGGAAGRYLPIKELTTWTPRWVICGRVTEKAPVNTFKRSDGGSGKVGSVDIMDCNVSRWPVVCRKRVCCLQGDSIRAKFWGDAADKWMNFLEQGQVRRRIDDRRNFLFRCTRFLEAASKSPTNGSTIFPMDMSFPLIRAL